MRLGNDDESVARLLILLQRLLILLQRLLILRNSVLGNLHD